MATLTVADVGTIGLALFVVLASGAAWVARDLLAPAAVAIAHSLVGRIVALTAALLGLVLLLGSAATHPAAALGVGVVAGAALGSVVTRLASREPAQDDAGDDAPDDAAPPPAPAEPVPARVARLEVAVAERDRRAARLVAWLTLRGRLESGEVADFKRLYAPGGDHYSAWTRLIEAAEADPALQPPPKAAAPILINNGDGGRVEREPPPAERPIDDTPFDAALAFDAYHASADDDREPVMPRRARR